MAKPIIHTTCPYCADEEKPGTIAVKGGEPMECPTCDGTSLVPNWLAMFIPSVEMMTKND